MAALRTSTSLAPPITLAPTIVVWLWLGLALALGLAGSGCSLRAYATRALADSLSGSGTSFASDDDPELVRDALPFALKTMEQVLPSQPRHVGLLTALASGFTSYAYAFVQVPAEEIEESSVERARTQQARASKLFLRARNYGLRGIEVRHPGAEALLRTLGPPQAQRRQAVLQSMVKEDVPLLYWTAAAWALAISNARGDLRLVGELPAVESLMARAAALHPDFDRGSIDEFYIAYDGGKDGGAPAARKHLERALALAHGHKLAALVSFAEAVDVSAQNRSEFKQLLERVLAFNVDQAPDDRLANLIAQRRARWLLGRIDSLFAE